MAVEGSQRRARIGRQQLQQGRRAQQLLQRQVGIARERGDLEREAAGIQGFPAVHGLGHQHVGPQGGVQAKQPVGLRQGVQQGT